MTHTPPQNLTYKDAGVDVERGYQVVDEIKTSVKATARPGSNSDLGGFGGLFDLKAAGFTDPILVAATDGIGTKLFIAIETNIYDTIGQDLVAMCVNDLIVQGAEPLFFLDYLASSKIDVSATASIVKSIAAACKACNCALIGGETAEMPGLYKKGDFDAAGFCVGAVERDGLINGNDVAVGDVIIGLPSSGIHSNGFSLVRKIVELQNLNYADPAPFDASKSLGAALLTPTELYVNDVIKALQTAPIHAMAHITGGGLIENFPRALKTDQQAVIDYNAYPKLPIFEWLQSAGNMTNQAMVETFNCGIGFAMIVPESSVAYIQNVLPESIIIGHIAARDADAPAIQIQGI